MKMHVQIRLARDEDADAIHVINRDALGYQYSLDKTRIHLNILLRSDQDRLFVACLDNTVVGYIYGAHYECTYDDPMKNIMALAVLPQYQGLGIGRMLLEALENWAKQEHCAGVRLNSGVQRSSAHQFYQHCGYALRKTQKNFYKIF